MGEGFYDTFLDAPIKTGQFLIDVPLALNPEYQPMNPHFANYLNGQAGLGETVYYITGDAISVIPGKPKGPKLPKGTVFQSNPLKSNPRPISGIVDNPKFGHNSSRPVGEIISKPGVPIQEGIYEFRASTGKLYVGQSGNIPARIQQHLDSGKLLPGEIGTVQNKEVLGGKIPREIAEQLRILEQGGVGSLENIRNPIGQARANLLPQWARACLGYN